MKVLFSETDGSIKETNVEINRYKILTGDHAGEIYIGYGCNARLSPTSPVLGYYDDGVWFPELNLRLKYEPRNPNYVNLVDAVDKNDKWIQINDKILYTSKGEVCSGVVIKFGDMFYVGCGYCTRKIQIIDDVSGKKVNINRPDYCVVYTSITI